MAQNSPGRPSGETPPSTDAAPRAGGERSLWHPGDGGAPLPGNRTRRQELADRRGWSTFSKARPVSRRTPLWSAGRRLVPRGARGRLRKASHRAASPAAHRRARTPPRLPALRSPRGSEELDFATAAYPAPIKEYGRRSVGLPAEASAKAGCLKSESVNRHASAAPSASCACLTRASMMKCRTLGSTALLVDGLHGLPGQARQWNGDGLAQTRPE
jgi:hypothetical protein